MRAALYIRKSNDDNDKAAENKSSHRQKEHGAAYAISKGWTVKPEHIFIDDGISGAEYQNRPAFFKMLNCLKEFDCLVISESSRLGRDMTRNAYYLTTILEAGVAVFYYLSDTEERADSPEARLMLTMKSYASEVERQKASERSRDSLKRKAEKGYCTGGPCYGFDLIPVYTTGVNGEQTKAYTDYRINEHQKEITIGIFTMSADGHGIHKITKTLDGDPRYRKYSLKYFDGKTPPPPRKSAGTWSPSAVYYLLRNERYLGIIPFGEFRQVYKGGTKKREKQSDYLKIAREDLRIIPQQLWEKVQARIKATSAMYIRSSDGKLQGKPDSGRDSKYLLSVITQCGICGHHIIGFRSGASHRRFYVCSYHSNRGSKVCSNDLRIPMTELDNLVLSAIKKDVLSKDTIKYIVKKSMDEIAKLQKEQPHRGSSLKEELRKTEQELKNLASAIASGSGVPKIILQEIKDRESKTEALKVEVARYNAPAQMNEVDYEKLEKALESRLMRFEELIFSDVAIARQVLRKLFKKPLILKPEEGGGYSLEGETALGPLLPPAKVTVGHPSLTQPTTTTVHKKRPPM